MENKVPDMSYMSSSTLELEPVLIDGQRVLFDEKVKLMPVTLEKKEADHE
ncbi:hypothetical protein [Sinomicrobium weinanense]|uniref:Uncharacterized protein n=1 Tax=Sinomicrobium weinanense TaxID=2842200 RepID=A0A926JP89_9FLAO|nr:hypothetical protein [Sinomicrobium weinanense]MBC9794793.1 hypothetical protein [Sinomicrobium weinanense]MBU3125052.1 hypothetical protein [Sinomicrobium weinanense]